MDKQIEAKIKAMMKAEAKAAIVAISSRNDLSKSDLIDSIEIDSSESKGGFIFDLLMNFYYKFVESGRRAGAKMPPADAILKWVRKYKIGDGKISENRLVYLIRRSISENGIKPRPFVDKLIQSIESQLEILLQEWLGNLLTSIAI